MAYKFNPLTGQFDLVNASSSGGGGDVNGPGSPVVDGDIVIFSGTSGTSIADSGVSIADLEPYSATFNTGSWTGPTGGSYSILISSITHGKANPTVHIYEISGSDYIEVTTGIKIDSSNNVIITINSTPDLRFDGKLIIS